MLLQESGIEKIIQQENKMKATIIQWGATKLVCQGGIIGKLGLLHH